MLVSYIDRIQQLLDRNPMKSAVIATSLDWAAAFDRQDPTIAVEKFLKMGVRPSLVPLLANYLSDRKMTVRFNNEISEIFALIGGGPQGTLLGGTEYLVQSINNLDTAQLICLAGLLIDYDVLNTFHLMWVQKRSFFQCRNCHCQIFLMVQEESDDAK